MCNLHGFQEGIDIIFRPSPDLTLILIRHSSRHDVISRAVIRCASILRTHRSYW